MDKSHPTSAALLSLLDAHYQLQDHRVQLWWQATGTLLANLLHGAGYDEPAQRRHALFYLYFIAPELSTFHGLTRKEPQWRSFMTDDNTPIELSWRWKSRGELSEVRYSVEPIGLGSGTATDPCNEYAAPRLLNRLQYIFPSLDLTLYNHFARELLPINADPRPRIIRSRRLTKEAKTPRSRTFLAFDLSRLDEVSVKAYFLPGARAAEQGCSNLSMIAQALQRMPWGGTEKFTSLEMLLEYTRSTAIGAQLECDIAGIDCVAAQKSRVKVYVRSRSTSFDSIRSVMTLGGSIENVDLENGLNKLSELWQLLFGQDQPLDGSMELPVIEHRTAGILYYFDISPQTSKPLPKVYLPVRHYGTNDYDIAQRLAEFMSNNGQSDTAASYLSTIKRSL
ncbi:MAG: hypothetical protein L6R37_006340 [Teloschistes peruensis]|nr:MAG: hypothetical protein L6R37_006340 [Teloschistes peruensis]